MPRPSDAERTRNLGQAIKNYNAPPKISKLTKRLRAFRENPNYPSLSPKQKLFLEWVARKRIPIVIGRAEKYLGQEKKVTSAFIKALTTKRFELNIRERTQKKIIKVPVPNPERRILGGVVAIEVTKYENRDEKQFYLNAKVDALIRELDGLRITDPQERISKARDIVAKRNRHQKF